jgi:hypothetical protein
MAKADIKFVNIVNKTYRSRICFTVESRHTMNLPTVYIEIETAKTIFLFGTSLKPLDLENQQNGSGVIDDNMCPFSRSRKRLLISIIGPSPIVLSANNHTFISTKGDVSFGHDAVSMLSFKTLTVLGRSQKGKSFWLPKCLPDS